MLAEAGWDHVDGIKRMGSRGWDHADEIEGMGSRGWDHADEIKGMEQRGWDHADGIKGMEQRGWDHADGIKGMEQLGGDHAWKANPMHFGLAVLICPGSPSTMPAWRYIPSYVAQRGGRKLTRDGWAATPARGAAR